MENYIFLSEEITPTSIKFIAEKIFHLEQDNKKDITLFINSNGGDIPSAFALVQIMNSVKNKITTVGIGNVFSSALIIFMAGDERKISKNASILSHQFRWNKDDKYCELVASRKEEELSMQRMLKHYKKYTKLSEEIIKKELLKETDVWLSAKETIKYNLADKII